MNCRRMEKLIPLYVEGDLEPARKEEMVAHLKSCERCSAIFYEYRESQGWIRSYTPPDFDAAFFDSLKMSVLDHIERERSRPSFFQLIAHHQGWNTAAATAIALLLVFAALAFYIYRGAAENRRANEGTLTVVPAPNEEPPQVQENQERDALRPAPRTGKRRIHPKRDYARSKEVYLTRIEPEITAIDLTGEQASQLELSERLAELERELDLLEPTITQPGLMRIEIQTSDPAIRIIWFAPEEKDSKPKKAVVNSD